MPNNEKFMNTGDLAAHWKISIRTLEKWRWQGIGPRYYKIGNQILYKRSDVKAFEEAGRNGYEQP